MYVAGLVIAGVGGVASFGGAAAHFVVRKQIKKEEAAGDVSQSVRDSRTVAQIVTGLGIALLVFGATLSYIPKNFAAKITWLVPGGLASLAFCYIAFTPGRTRKGKITLEVIKGLGLLFASLSFTSALSQRLHLGSELREVADYLALLGVASTVALPYLSEIGSLANKYILKRKDS